jgi:hypothetical protein
MRKKKNTQRSRGIAMVVVAIVLAGSSSMRAQIFTPAKPDAERTPGWIFTPSIGVGGSWDDNVLLVNPGDEPPSDYASPINPSVSLDFTGKRTRFSTGYDGSVVLYRTLDELTSFEQFLRVALEHHATEHVTIFAEENFTMAPTTDAVPLNGGVPFYRIGSRTNAAGGGVRVALQRYMSLSGHYTLRTVDFDFDPLLGTQLHGGNSHEFDVSLDRAISSRLTVGGEYGFDRVTVAAVTAVEPAADDRFNIQVGSFTARYLLSPTVTISGALGITHLGAGLTHQSRTAPAWRAAITHKMQHVLLSGSYSRSYVPSFGFGGTLQNEEWAATAVVPFARNRAYAEGGLTWFDNDALEAGQPSLSTVWLSGKVGYRVTRWLRMEGFYNRSHQDTHRAGGQLSRNQIGFQVVTARPLKLR